jgi:glycosyltransferase involved in cell wall biosynthesis
MSRNDVAIYTTSAATAGLYDRAVGRTGGAERQMALLARTLSASGFSVAHIVYPPRDPLPLPDRLSLIHRGPYAGSRRVVGGALEALRIWRALQAAEARVAVVRTASPAVSVVALFCRLRQRSMIFSTSSNFDFDSRKIPGRLDRALYRLGVRLAAAIVVQSQDQVELARQAFPKLRRIERIASFAETASASDNGHRPAAFLWVGRLVSSKRPMHYVELARALPDARFIMIAVPQKSGPIDIDDLRTAVKDVPNLELVDPVPHEQLSELVADAVAIVNSSTFEGMPNVFLEAWARGVPALSLQFDPDNVIAGRGLGIVAGGSWEHFVAGARELWETRADREELSLRTRSYVAEVHSPVAVGARWSDLIRELDTKDRARIGKATRLGVGTRAVGVQPEGEHE